MDNKLKILLGSEKNINSVNVDNYNKIELIKKENRLTEFNVNDVVNSTEIFDNERENNPVYRIYGKIEYLSLLNGLKLDYEKLEDFFNPEINGNIKTIFNSFDFYLVAPADSGYYFINNTNKYKRKFKVIATPNDFEIYNAGYNTNVFGEQTYIFSFKTDFNVKNMYDGFGFPLTELFLYAQYKKDINKDEEMSYIKWSTSTGNKTKSTLNIDSFNFGDIITTNDNNTINDIVEYNKEEFSQEQVDIQKYYIRTKYYKNTYKKLEWSYNPFIPIRLRYFDSVVSTGKLSNIVENSTYFDITNINNPNIKINLFKSSKQNLNSVTKTINNWDNESNSNFVFNANNGYLKILNSGNYRINFKTQIYLSEETDKYIAKTIIEKSSNGSTWITIPNTTRFFYDNNIIDGVMVNYYFNSGEYIRIRTSLIPNPNERKLELIPDYATIIEDSGKFVWRDILRQGYIDPISNVGVDYPFFNGKRYLFLPLIFSIVPNLSTKSFEKHQNTIDVFSEISYSDDAIIINEKPITDLDNIGKPCQ